MLDDNKNIIVLLCGENIRLTRRVDRLPKAQKHMESSKLGTPMTSDTRLRYALGAAIGLGVLGAPDLACTDAQEHGEIAVFFIRSGKATA